VLAGVSFAAPRGKFDIEFRQSSLSFVDKNGALAATCPISNISVSIAARLSGRARFPMG
jgi:hypothetical protein